MNRSLLFLCLVITLCIVPVQGQVSPDCANAVPICNNTPVNGGTSGMGIDDFNGATSSGNLELTLNGTIESNSAWYRFKTGAAGQLGFNIGFDSNEDWDFALYKDDACGQLGEPVRSNFFDNTELNSYIGVGEDPTGVMNFQYEEWLDVQPGEDYYLLINNFSNTNSGFSIQFSGAIFTTNPYDALDCSIIDNLLGPPISACEYDDVVLDATTPNASIYNWFMDTGAGFSPIVGENNPTLMVTQSALYRVEVVIPPSGVEVGKSIFSEVQVAFSEMPTANAASDETLCAGSGTFNLGQKDVEVLGNQDSAKFRISYHSSLADAVSGANSLPFQHDLQMGTESIYVRIYSIENPGCFDAPISFDINVLANPTLNFAEEVFLCEGEPSIQIGASNPDSKYTYMWSTGETTSSITVAQPGSYTLTVTHALSGTNCATERTVTVSTSNPPVISEVEIADLSNNNTIRIFTEGEGYEFSIDRGEFQPSNFFQHVPPGSHVVTVSDPKGCGSIDIDVVVVGFPKFFTPNDDLMNDYWHIQGLENLDQPVVSIYDRFGKLLAQLDANSIGWDGTYNGNRLPATDYWFKLSFINMDGQRTMARYINNHFSLRR